MMMPGKGDDLMRGTSRLQHRLPLYYALCGGALHRYLLSPMQRFGLLADRCIYFTDGAGEAWEMIDDGEHGEGGMGIHRQIECQSEGAFAARGGIIGDEDMGKDTHVAPSFGRQSWPQGQFTSLVWLIRRYPLWPEDRAL